MRYHGAGLTVLGSREIKTGSREALAVRLRRIFDEVTQDIQTYRPDALVLEKIFSHAHHPSAALALGHARGVIALLAGCHDIPLIEMPATRVKRAVTSRGHASKKQVQRMVSHLAGLRTPAASEHIADALALVIAYTHTIPAIAAGGNPRHDRKADRNTAET